MRTKIAAALAASAIVCVSAGAANAVTSTNILYDNLYEATAGATPYSDFTLGRLAQSFSTGAAAVSLGDVSVLLQADYADPPGDYGTVSLLADDSATPGAVLATLGTVDDGELSLTPTVYTFSGGQQLAADTRYWIEISGTDMSIGGWNSESDDSGAGVAGEYVFNANGVSSDSNGAYQMAVTAAPAIVSGAPEPTTWLLMMAGIGGAGLWLRRAKASLASRITALARS
jgi:hypothetical protein